MNHCVPEWNLDDDSSSSYHLLRMTNNKKLMEPDQELMELLWRNGHVVMQNHSYYKPELGMKWHSSLGNSSNLVQDDEIASLFPYSLDELLEKEDCSNLSYENLAAEAIDTDKLNNEAITGHRWVTFGAQEENSALTESFSEESSVRFQINMVYPPKLQSTSTTHNVPCIENGGSVNFPHFSRPEKADFQSVSGRIAERESGDGIRAKSGEHLSNMIAGSSNCGNNQIQNNADLSHNLSNKETGLPSGGMQTGTYDNTVTSSSGGSGCSFGKTEQHGTSNQSHKRKFRDTEESDCHTEKTEYDESGPTYKLAQRSSSARRSRSSEVHNLSERRRRDRINEKMKALQELIPFCNKSNKASMLDEAIEYLKTLQLQVQMMWMGGGIAPIMFTGAQKCTSPMVEGMGHPPLHSLHDLIHLSRVPTVNRYLASAPTGSEMQMFPSQPFNPITANQMQNFELPESYARYLGYHHMKPPLQTANLYTYGTHMIQQSEMAAAAASGSYVPTDVQVPSKSILNGKSG